MPKPGLQFLFHILQSEQSILARTDQKAYTLLSVLGVFMVFFIAYYRMMVINMLIVSLLAIYFAAGFLAIYRLVRTIQPRIRGVATPKETGRGRADPTYFGGIRQFTTSDDYFDYLKEVEDDEDEILRLLSRQVHALAHLNWEKNSHLRKGMQYFVLAIGSELVMILSTFVKMGLDVVSVQG